APPDRRLREVEAVRGGSPPLARARRPDHGAASQRHRLWLQPAHALRPGGQHVREGRAAAGAAHAARRRLDVAPAGRRLRRLGRVDITARTSLSDPRHYNIRWLELLNELRPRLGRLDAVT